MVLGGCRSFLLLVTTGTEIIQYSFSQQCRRTADGTGVVMGYLAQVELEIMDDDASEESR